MLVALLCAMLWVGGLAYVVRMRVIAARLESRTAMTDDAFAAACDSGAPVRLDAVRYVRSAFGEFIGIPAECVFPPDGPDELEYRCATWPEADMVSVIEVLVTRVECERGVQRWSHSAWADCRNAGDCARVVSQVLESNEREHSPLPARRVDGPPSDRRRRPSVP